MSGMTFGPEDKTAAQILRDPTSSFSDIEAVARYIETLEPIFAKILTQRQKAVAVTSGVLSREESEILGALYRGAQ